MESAARLMPRVYRTVARQASHDEALLLALWPVVVGAKVAARTRAVRLFGATLIVEVVAQDWRKQLARMTHEVVARLNDAAGREVLGDIEFRVQVGAQPRPLARAVSATGFDEAAAIADPHLRRIYRQSKRRAQAK